MQCCREQTLFELHYDAQDRVAIQATNGKFVTTMKNGRLSAASNCTELAAAGDNELFWPTLVNRNVLAFQGDHGYVVLKNEKQGRLECNLAQYQVWTFESAQPGSYKLFDDKQRGWKLCDDGFIALVAAEQAEAFGFRFRQQNKVAIRAPNGSYLKGEQNGSLKACASLDDAHLWEIWPTDFPSCTTSQSALSDRYATLVAWKKRHVRFSTRWQYWDFSVLRVSNLEN